MDLNLVHFYYALVKVIIILQAEKISDTCVVVSRVVFAEVVFTLCFSLKEKWRNYTLLNIYSSLVPNKSLLMKMKNYDKYFTPKKI